MTFTKRVSITGAMRQQASDGLTILGIGLSLLVPVSSHASEIATNIYLSFSESADFSQGIDKLLSLDSATADARLLTTRLGTFSGGSMVFTLNGRQSVSINDPGVATLPEAQRNFLQANASATATGGLIAEPVALNLNTLWFCVNTSLKCNSNEVFSPLRSNTPAMNAPADASALLAPIHLQASATATLLNDNATLNFGKLHLNGTWQVNAQFTAKTTTQYVTDALNATSGLGGTGSARWGSAAADVLALRTANWTDVTVVNNLKASRTPELEAAQRLLAVARDSAALVATGNADGTSFTSQFSLTQQLWNVVATADPALGRSAAGSHSENLLNTDVAAELAVMRMILNGANDTSFVSDLAHALGNPLTVSSSPVLTLDGALLGLTDATLSVFYLGSDSGRVEIELAGAERYALWRTGFENIAFLEGAADGVTVLGGNYDGTQIRLGETQYIGEGFGGLLYLSGNQTASRLQLNNFYSNQLLVVASWAVTPVPEPSVWCLLLFGLVLIGRMKRN
ncbi:MAG TPA: PEP-CTERM sorting domain-containing protein [Methylophilus sp.]|uniref:PEP-CTERM sorting domain-containing protein n=1 Tax=Methylophilus sp. TaxID=29541 RepID=UPI002B852B5C|nr:PEP-CTERM sorting domain-containing protein [Methylophilus sp.]HSH86339.1 PEP-CTERM sorting domain-containing protein [Methylophilus sp.]